MLSEFGQTQTANNIVPFMPKRLSATEFINRSIETHGSRYDYSKVVYKNSTTKISILCSIHGEFQQSPSTHMRGTGCPSCSGFAPIGKDRFIERADRIHKHKFDYSEVRWANTSTKVTIICPEHGPFSQVPSSHLKGHGCLYCSGKQQLDTRTFVIRAAKIHKSRYDYSKVEYKKSQVPAIIICPDHGEFSQKPNSHLRGQGCPSCGGTKGLSLERVLARFRSCHGDKYDYSKVVYRTTKTKVLIICPSHGEFEQLVESHMAGRGCPKCSKWNPLTQEEMLRRFHGAHGDKYDYSEAKLTRMRDNVRIICPIHGVFFQRAEVHTRGGGCITCAGTKPLTTEDFIKRSREKHGKKYDYSLANFKGSGKKITIICATHGEFRQLPHSHMDGSGCIKCAGLERLTTEEFIRRAVDEHGNRYDYTESEYVNSNTKVKIICRRHGPFIQYPAHHYRGVGCPKCRESKGEKKVRYFLRQLGVRFEEQHDFEGKLRNPDTGRFQTVDFYLPDYGVAIEYDGEHHSQVVKYNHEPDEIALARLQVVQERDAHKNQFCENEGIDLVRIRFDQSSELEIIILRALDEKLG